MVGARGWTEGGREKVKGLYQTGGKLVVDRGRLTKVKSSVAVAVLLVHKRSVGHEQFH